MVWAKKEPNLKPGQLFNVPVLKEKLKIQHERETRFVKHTRRFETEMVRCGIPARMPQVHDGEIDKTLGIPVKIANFVRRRSLNSSHISHIADVSYLMSPPPSPVSVATSPGTGRRVTTIEVVKDDPDSDSDDDVFCSTPLKTSPIRPHFDDAPSSRSKNIKKRSPLTVAQVEEVLNRQTRKVRLNRKRKASSAGMDVAFTCDELENRQQVRGKKSRSKEKKTGPMTSTPLPNASSLSMGHEMDGTTVMFPASGSSKSYAEVTVGGRRIRKRMKLTHDLTQDNLSKVSNIRRKLFQDISIIAAPVR